MSSPIGETALVIVWGTTWLYIASVVPIECRTLVTLLKQDHIPFQLYIIAKLEVFKRLNLQCDVWWMPNGKC